jgi:hypothetical protein
MHADRRIDILVLFGHLDSTLKCSAMRITRPHIQDGADSCLTRTPNHLVAVAHILFTINMRVGIDKHGNSGQ